MKTGFGVQIKSPPVLPAGLVLGLMSVCSLVLRKCRNHPPGRGQVDLLALADDPPVDF